MSTLYKCRLCLKSTRNKIAIFKDDFPKMIQILTGLAVNQNDDFPKTSCLDCAKNVKLALKTRKQIIQSHKILQENYLQQCKVLNTSAKKSSLGFMNTSTIECRSQGKNDFMAKRITRNNSKPSSYIASTFNIDQLKEENNQLQNSVSDAKNKSLEKEHFSDDSVSDDTSTNLASDWDSDQDWKPDKKKPILLNLPETQEESRRSNTKASDGVFFVKKRNTSRVKQKKSETIVKIKKKPKEKTPPTRVTCEICKKEVQKIWLQKHMETHEYNPVTCEFCGLVSKSATALRHHVFYYHRCAADEYMCDQCGKSFRSKYRLNLHKKKEHGGTKDFECTTCGKKFFEKMHLKRHIDKTHKNIRPYICDFCGKSFKSRNHIKIHERIHSKEAPYTCHMCGESFKMKLTLRTHLKGVHNIQEEQKVFCSVCNRGFASEMALKAHLNSRIHETEKCRHCSEMFTREYMVNHLKGVHGGAKKDQN